MKRVVAVSCTVDFFDLIWSLESKNSIFDMLRKVTILSVKIRVNCEKGKVEQQKNHKSFRIVTTNYVRVSSKAIYLRMIITQILITSIN